MTKNAPSVKTDYEKSKHIVGLLQDEERLKNERVQALKAKERFAQASQGFGSTTKAETAAVPATTTPGSIEQGGRLISLKTKQTVPNFIELS